MTVSFGLELESTAQSLVQTCPTVDYAHLMAPRKETR